MKDKDKPKDKPKDPRRAELILSYAALLKLNYFCYAGDTEVGGFAISDPENPLRIIDFRLVKQRSTFATVDLSEGLADYVEACVFDEKLPLERCYRIWWHTHPEMSAQPSGTDEATFADPATFGGPDVSWSVMFIFSKTRDTYARLRIRNGNMQAVQELKVVAENASALSDEEWVATMEAMKDLPRQYREMVQKTSDWTVAWRDEKSKPAESKVQPEAKTGADQKPASAESRPPTVETYDDEDDSGFSYEVDWNDFPEHQALFDEHPGFLDWMNQMGYEDDEIAWMYVSDLQYYLDQFGGCPETDWDMGDDDRNDFDQAYDGQERQGFLPQKGA
jgi:hypothetical protein